MFFSNELLSKRDSGFGFLWLAATLGSRSTVKKLPRRSVLTADISALCTLIAQPSEPLALRLSSGLMVGVARVYKAKHEIFVTDVTSCFTSLKKAVHEMRSTGTAGVAGAGGLDMGQPMANFNAITISSDAGLGFALDFDFLEPVWADYVVPRPPSPPHSNQNTQNDISANLPDIDLDNLSFDRDFPSSSAPAPSQKLRAAAARRSQHTLNEAHLHLFGSVDPDDLPDTRIADDAFGLDGEIDLGIGMEAFGPEEGADGGVATGEDGGFGDVQMNFDDQPLGADDQLGVDVFDDQALDGASQNATGADPNRPRSASIDPGRIINNENYVPSSSIPPPSIRFPSVPFSNLDPNIPQTFLNALSLAGSPQKEGTPSNHSRHEGEGDESAPNKKKRVNTKKRNREVFIDSQIELADDELRASRDHYEAEQKRLSREAEARKRERDAYQRVQEMLWGVPKGFDAPEIAELYKGRFKALVEARSGGAHLDNEFAIPRLPAKRRKRNSTPQQEWEYEDPDTARSAEVEKDANVVDIWGGQDDMGMGGDADMGGPVGGQWDWAGAPGDNEIGGRFRSSEEPEVGRRGSSRPESILAVGMGIGLPESQKSSVLPWDIRDAPSSSTPGRGRFSSRGQDVSIDDDVDLGINTPGRRESSSLASNWRSGGSAVGMGDLGDPEGMGDTAEFELEETLESQLETQDTLTNLQTLERNSHNFLEYTRIQLEALPGDATSITFKEVVPVEVSTPRVAAAAFYHTLMLATKDLIQVEQQGPYEDIRISIC
ncbi:hypothetical protein BOTBODRAFT_37164 [Botryobasidium botryosum FD-172 SS1]|uniref:Rad21/Rec8-like protein N-terminal domain-containing protein n=1 Tax=Botryobasidium botryosum (strain FD-172 SS1) TaxID=930990 RepID=A0A067M0J1_BOTB1|nr:hypothetical protein BOTBODRAFT_37164 [Botryobasidium botryosum FD-172 SS1]